MANFLIEIPHPDANMECEDVVKLFLSSGSYLLANASWGCQDNVHKAWLYVDANNRDEALQLIPPYFRKLAKIIKVMRFNFENAEKIANPFKAF